MKHENSLKFDLLWIFGFFFYKLFGLSFWRHPFTAKELIYILDGLRVAKF